MAKLPQGIIEMTKWPNTPTQARLKRALAFHTNATQSNALMIQVQTDHLRPAEAKKMITAVLDTAEAGIVINEVRWQEWATTAFSNELAQDKDSLERRIKLIISIIREADTKDTMGFAAISDPPAEYPKPGQVQIGMARMLRSSNWMGFCSLFKNVDGLAAVVVQSRDDPERIGHVFCAPIRYLTEDDGQVLPDDAFEIQGGTELQAVLRWHGVTRIYWKPISDSPGNQTP